MQIRRGKKIESALSLAARVVVVDDDAELRELIATFLRDHGMTVATAGNAAELDVQLKSSPVDLIVLDIMMPGEDGLSVVRRLSPNRQPSVIMLSAMGDDRDRIAGLDFGADDYLAKPCNPSELLARIRAVLRRRRGHPEPQPVRLRHFGDCELDLITRQLRREGRPDVQLTDAEFRVLTSLLDMPQVVLSRDQLLDAARGETADIFDRAIDVTVSRLRRKLGGGEIIRTIRSEGYMLATAPENV